MTFQFHNGELAFVPSLVERAVEIVVVEEASGLGVKVGGFDPSAAVGQSGDRLRVGVDCRVLGLFTEFLQSPEKRGQFESRGVGFFESFDHDFLRWRRGGEFVFSAGKICGIPGARRRVHAAIGEESQRCHDRLAETVLVAIHPTPAE